MLLAIDCGNTNTVFSIWDETRFLATWRIATDHKRTADEYFVWLSSLMMLTKTEATVTQAIISSTVPRVVFNLRVLCNRYFDCRPLVVGKPECRLPVAPRVDRGTTVGPDRLVNTVAGFDRHGGNLIIVDFGTATTFDVVDTDGAYIGGVIAPGVNLSLEALAMAAAALPHIKSGKVKPIVVTGLKRHPLLPDIPTFKDLGYEGFDGIQWYGISGPAQIPDKIRNLLNMEINKAIRNPELKDRLSAEAIEPMPMSSDQYTLYIKNDIARWTRVATERKIQLD
jgi:type III pantothenate kinase